MSCVLSQQLRPVRVHSICGLFRQFLVRESERANESLRSAPQNAARHLDGVESQERQASAVRSCGQGSKRPRCRVVPGSTGATTGASPVVRRPDSHTRHGINAP